MISVIIPSHNRGDLIKRTIESIVRQDYGKIEIIIVDDASDEKHRNILSEICSSYSCTRLLINDRNMGAGFSRKFGFSKAQGDYVVFCDDDDFYCDNSFYSKAINLFNNDASLCMVSGNAFNYILETDEKYKYQLNIGGKISAREYLINFQYRWSKPASTFTSIFKKTVLSDAIMNKMEMVNDSSIYLRALLNGENVYIMDDIIGCYVAHSDNMSNNIDLDFLISNLNEKYLVKKELNGGGYFNADEILTWWRGQINITVDYYCLSLPKFTKLIKLFYWLSKHTENDFVFLIKKYIITQLRVIRKKVM